MEELHALAANRSLSTTHLAELGRAFARAVAVVSDEKRDEFAAKAVAAVRRAVETGGFPTRDSFRRFLTDPVFATIRTRTEFEELERRIAEKR